MATLNKQQIDELLKNKPSNVTDEQVVKSILERGHFIEGLSENLPQPEPKGLVGTQTQQRVSNVVQSAGAEVTRAIQGEGEFQGQTPIRRGVGATAAAVTAVPESIVAASPEPVRNVVEGFGEKISSGFQKLVNFIGDNKQLQKFVMDNPDTARAIEEVAGTISPLGEIAGSILGARELVRVGEGTTRLTDDVLKSTFRKSENPVDQVTPTTVVTTAKIGNPELYNKAKSQLVKTYMDSIVTTPTAKKRLSNLAISKGVDEQKLIDDFVEAGGFANRVDDDGRVYFDETKRDFKERKNELGEAISEYMSRQTELTDLSSLRQSALASVQSRGEIFGYNKSIREINKLFDDAEAQFGTTQITPLQLHELRIKANERFPNNPENYEVDAYTAIGDAARNRIDEIVGDETIKQANLAWGNLAEQERLIPILEGQKVDVGLLNDSIGSYIGASAIGTAGLASGSGSLVIAGLASTLGQKAFANWIRRRRINDPEVQQVLDVLREDQMIANQLIADIKKIDTEAARRIEEGLLLPAQNETSAPIILGPAEPGRGPGSRVISN